MFQLVKSEVRDLTPELAREFRDLEPSPTERDLNPVRVKHLNEKATAGQLVTFHWSAATHGKRRLRMNGQHSSTMLCELNGDFPKGLKVHLDEYKVDNVDDLALLFRQFDDRKSGRSVGDVSGAYQGLYEPLREVPKTSAKLAIDGVSWHRRHVVGMPVPAGDEVYSLFGETGLHSFIRWVGDVFSIKTPEMKRAQVVSAMYATFSVNEEDSKAFWGRVAAGGVEYEDNAPATVLDAWLKSLADKQAKNGNGKAKEVKPAHYYQGCIYAWNAYREDRTLKDIKYEHKSTLSVVE